jgi:hypothetical protein
MQITKTSSKRARRSRAEWAKEVRRYRASGQGASEYAATHGLNAGTLCVWASKLGKVEAPERGERHFVPVRVTGESARPRDERLGEVEVTLRNGWRVRVAGEVPPEGLVDLLELLEGGRRC